MFTGSYFLLPCCELGNCGLERRGSAGFEGCIDVLPLVRCSQAPRIMDAARTAIHFLRNEAARSDNLVELASKIVLSAHGLAVPHESLVAARDVLQQADRLSSATDAMIDLEAAAMGVKGAASAQLITLRNPAVELAAACKEYLEGSCAMTAVQRAATERARQRESAAAPVQNVPPPPAPGPGQVSGFVVKPAFYLPCVRLTDCTV